MQCVFLHGGNQEISVRREGCRRVRAGPFKLDRLTGSCREMKRRAIITRYGDAQALGGKSNALDGSLMLEIVDRAVRKAHMRSPACTKSDCTTRPCRHGI